jgi:hypothetical protein
MTTARRLAASILLATAMIGAGHGADHPAAPASPATGPTEVLRAWEGLRYGMLIHLHSIRAFELQVPDGRGGWKAISKGGTIGGPGVDLSFPPVQADRFRLAITDSTGGPTIWDFAVYPHR